MLKTNIALAAALAAATPLAALDLASRYQEDPHLSPLPRTDAERARIEAVTSPATDFSAPEPYEDLPAGAATVRARTDDEAFSQHSANLSFEQELEFKLGNGLFKKIWVFSPPPPRPPMAWARSTTRAPASAAT